MFYTSKVNFMSHKCFVTVSNDSDTEMFTRFGCECMGNMGVDSCVMCLGV